MNNIENAEIVGEEFEEFDLKEELRIIDEKIAEFKEDAAIGKAIEALRKDPNYIKVVSTLYFEKEAQRLFELLTEPTPLKRDSIENVIDMVGSIRHFKTFMNHKMMDAADAERKIEDEQEYRLKVTASGSGR